MLAGQQQIDPNRVAIYIRWSTDEQGQGTTLEVQRDACRHFLLSQGWNFRDDLVFVDDGWSGATLDRPALTKLREAVRKGVVACVVVYKLDRLSRNLLDCVGLVRQEWADIALSSTKENFDTQSPVGQMIFNILVSFAEFERNVIRDRTMSGKVKRAEQGKWLGSRAPYGYRLVKSELTAGGTTSELVPDPDTAPMVRQIFDWSANGVSSVGIATRLNSMGVPNPTGGLWTVQGILVLLRNPTYTGRVVYGRPTAKRKYLREQVEAEGTHEPLVDRMTWDAVQQACSTRSVLPPRVIGSPYSFSGLVECATCGVHMAGDKWTWGETTGAKKSVKIYRCRTRGSTGTCVAAKVKERDVEAAFLTWAEQFLQDDGVRSLVEQRLRKQKELMESVLAARHQAEQRLAQIERALERLDRGYLEAGTISDDEYRVKKTAYKTEAADLRAQLAAPVPEGTVVDLDAMIERAKELRTNWQVLDPQERRVAAASLLDFYGYRIVVNSDKTVNVIARA